MISKESIEELQQIIKEDYGKDLNFKDASEIAHGLVGYFGLLSKLHHRIQKNRNS